ncbi:beta-ketoacyl-[acyl-carrier-protein] synthase family protein [Alienimonas californiensis]|uniref:3-oxoacyl-[acyl-carrier-protein] synthase 2 n=1 Tax=Alienimonas californiensis TaxID=2527989 RepID=A0A517PF36_9PLAN|nr:beta-ketoacyl synthase N-terminal-like domain-containing protein [Alienimonas californiensis]QDT17974.1 3-oxoacyl-[acyl-carrier-protein] synthase 2 [Alienimonas californiensis]
MSASNPASHGSRRRVVITGIGVVSPLGIGVQSFLEALKAKRSGVDVITDVMDASAAPGNVGGEIPGFDDGVTKEAMPKKQRKFIKVMCREIELGVVSALHAVEHSGLDLDAIDRSRMGVDFGANLMFSPPHVLAEPAVVCCDPRPTEAHESGLVPRFDLDRWGSQGMKMLEPLWLLNYLPNMPACHIGIALDARGPSNSLTMGGASGNLALSEAARIIERGRADVMVAGTTGTHLHPVRTLNVELFGDLADGDGPPGSWCKPWDAHRSGQVVGEAACTVILEEREHAEARGATIYGELLGFGSGCVSTLNATGQLAKAYAVAGRAALRDADLSPADLGHVNGHGVGTRDADAEECRGLSDLLAGAPVPITGLKGFTGNAGSGSGVQELVASLLMLREGLIPVCLNHDSADGDCGELQFVAGDHRPDGGNKVFLNLNGTRGGQASAAIVRAE